MSDLAALHRAALDAVESHDFERLRSLYHDEFVYVSADGTPLLGPDGGVAIAQAFIRAFPDLSFRVLRQVVSGEHSVVEFSFRGTHTGELDGIAPSGRTVEMTACNVMEFRDGKILWEHEYFDNHTFLKQLGAIE